MSPGSYALSGRVVLITGAARGIGAAVARRLVADGASVSLVGLEPQELARRADELGPRAMWVEADVTQLAALQEAAKLTAERLGGIDVAIANAGIGISGSVLQVDPTAFDHVLEVNLLGVWRTVRACLPYVIERRGYVLNVASVAAVLQAPGMASYGAAKAGVEAFSNALRSEVRHRGVDVGVAYFSWLDTDLVRGADARASARMARAKLKGPLGRTYPVSVAVEAIARGIQRRSAVVVAPGWVRGVLLARGLLGARLAGPLSRQYAALEPIAEREAHALGVEAYHPVGPGGAAAWQARGGPAAGPGAPPQVAASRPVR
jgi:NAD(P)-dependent dehydrogenase (short-subunit alcohol dehydrogenase family)